MTTEVPTLGNALDLYRQGELVMRQAELARERKDFPAAEALRSWAGALFAQSAAAVALHRAARECSPAAPSFSGVWMDRGFIL